ncbi:Hypothetical predicted protein, partial [Pelobates cultripes]
EHITPKQAAGGMEQDRRHMVPTKLKHIDPKQTGACWRCGNNIGDTLQAITTLWEDTQTLIQKVGKVDIPLAPEIFLLQHIPPRIPKPQRYLTYHITIVVITAIAKAWLQKDPPSIETCIPQLETIKTYERIARAHRAPQKFWVEAWRLWDAYANSPN